MHNQSMNERINIVLEKLYHPDLKEIDLSLGRMERALEAAGSPHLTLPPVIHLAGTNGKGSTLAMLRSMYEAAGYQVHAYTSPHLVHLRERFYCAGEYLDDAALIERLERVLALTKEYPLTFFEATTLLAFQLFSEVPADVVLLETGMGGQFDATNVVPKPALTVITPISMDHQAFLGDTLGAIAYEKACIMKAEVPCIAAPQSEEAGKVLSEKAEELAVTLNICGKDFEYEKVSDGLYVNGERYSLPRLEGEHQLMNAAVAIQSVQRVQHVLPIEKRKINQGLEEVSWPARMQLLDDGKYANWAKGLGAQLWLDGGHNEAAAQEIARWMQSRVRPCHLVIAMSHGHAPEAFLSIVMPHAASVSVMAIPDERLSHDVEHLHECARRVDAAKTQPIIAGGLMNVLQSLVELTGEKSDVLLIGSLYFAGKILAEMA